MPDSATIEKVETVEDQAGDEAIESVKGDPVKPTPKRTPEEAAKFDADALQQAIKLTPGAILPPVSKKQAEAQPRSEDGKFAAKDGEGEKEPKEPKEPDDTAKTATEAVGEPETREREVMARRALRRDGWDDADIDALDKTKLVAIGEKRTAAQAKTDLSFENLKRAQAGKPPIPDSAATNAAKAGPTDGSDAERGTNAATDADLVPASVAEYLDDATKAELAKSIKGREAKAVKPWQDALDQASSALAEERAISIQHELSAEFPALKAEKPPVAFLERMKRIKSGYDLSTRAGVRELMRDAATIEFGPAQIQQTRQTSIERNRAARNGVPDTKDLSGKGAGKGITRDEYERLAAEAALKGGGNLIRAQQELQRLTGGRT